MRQFGNASTHGNYMRLTVAVAEAMGLRAVVSWAERIGLDPGPRSVACPRNLRVGAHERLALLTAAVAAFHNALAAPGEVVPPTSLHVAARDAVRRTIVRDPPDLRTMSGASRPRTVTRLSCAVSLSCDAPAAGLLSAATKSVPMRHAVARTPPPTPRRRPRGGWCNNVLRSLAVGLHAKFSALVGSGQAPRCAGAPTALRAEKIVRSQMRRGAAKRLLGSAPAHPGSHGQRAVPAHLSRLVRAVCHRPTSLNYATGQLRRTLLWGRPCRRAAKWKARGTALASEQHRWSPKWKARGSYVLLESVPEVVPQVISKPLLDECGIRRWPRSTSRGRQEACCSCGFGSSTSALMRP